MRKKKGIFEKAGDFIANFQSRNVQNGTDEAIKGMELFLKEADTNRGFDTAKGFLFEYIEAAKFNRNAAYAGSDVRAVVTASKGNPHDAADIILKNEGRTVQKIQAKFVSPSHKNDGVDHSAEKSAFYQAGGQKEHWGKYHGMKRLIRKEDEYKNGQSFLETARQITSERAKSGSHAGEYADVAKNLTDEIKYKGVSSGGTTESELMEAYFAPEEYARGFLGSSYGKEVVVSAKNGAASGAIMGGLASCVQNMCEVLSDKKELNQAIQDIGADAVKSGVRGGGVGALGSALHITGKANKIPVLSDTTAAVIIAGSVIDGGASLYAYVKGEITEKELQGELVDTTVKSTATIFVMKGLEIALKSTGPLAPIIVYSVASQIVTSARTIIENARLNAEEYNRAAALLEESVKLMQEYHSQANQYLLECEQEQRKSFAMLLDGFTFNPVTGEGYEETVATITKYAERTGIELQHADFDDYCRAMKTENVFVLK